MANSETGASTSDSLGGEYQVFLSFRGPDTRRGFTNVLYHALKDVGIHVFIDDEELRPGEVISGNLLRAINDSKVYIPIFSRTYASSHWCLRELAKMVENTFKSEDGNKKVILPVFYDVRPDDVKLKTELYKNAISKLEEQTKDQKKKFSTEDVETWRHALREVDGIKGWESQKYPGDGDLIKMVVKEVLEWLKTRQREVTKDLVGMEDRIAAINNLLDVDSGGVRLIGIYGMGGVGKTTLAKKIFNQLCPRFGKNCSFLGDVRETAKTKGLVKLQEQLLSDISKSRVARDIIKSDDGIKAIEETICNKEVLIVLDDVDNGDQIRKLIGRDSLYAGTRILVTTRDIGVLNIRGFKYGFERYELEGLSDEHALQLFSRHAFNYDSPLADYHTLSKDIVSTTGGLPLALEAIGSLLFGVEKKKIWKERLEKLRKTPNQDVLGKLRISYDALESDHQQIFLDVACFFIGENKTNPIYMWEDYEFGPEDAIDCLVKRCMIKVLDGDRFWMHDQFRDLGRAIAKKERTRLWDKDDVVCELRSTEIKGSVKALRLEAMAGNPITVTAKEIEQFPNLQFLWLSDVISQGDFTGCLSKLKWIYLNHNGRYPGYRTTNFHLENVVVMYTRFYEWAEWYKSPVPIVEAKKLKVLNLRCADWLHRIPTFSGCSVLEKLTIFNCGIFGIDCSIGELKCLTELIVEGCEKLSQLPEQIGELKNLRHLSVKRCRNLRELPDSVSKLESLTELDVSSTGITSLPDSMDKLSQLHTLDLTECQLQELPELPKSLTSLQLKTRSLKIMPDLSNLSNLVELTLSHRSEIGLRAYPIQPCHLPWIGGLSKLRKMDLCLENVHATSTDWASLTLLEELTLYGLDLQMLKLDGLPQLEKLTIECCVLTSLSITWSLGKLREATVSSCNELVEVQFIGVLKLMEILEIRECGSLERLVCASEEEPGCNEQQSHELTEGLRRASIVSGSLKMLQNLSLERCPELQEIQFDSMMESLEILVVTCCDSLRKLGGLSNLKNLKTLQIEKANSLQIVEGIDELERVERLTIDGCRSVGRIIDVSSSKIPKECRMELRFCGELPGTDPYGPSITWECYREKILNAPTQASASDIETTFPNCEVETGDPLLEQEATKLKVLNLSDADCSHKTPTFSEHSVLEKLSICRCQGLAEIDCSIGKLRCLTELIVEDCEELSKLPEQSGELKNLQHLSLAGCFKLRQLPDSISKLESLKTLDVRHTSITSLPDSMDKLQSLSSLNLSYTKIVKLPGTMSKLSQLHTLDLSECHEIQELPELPISLTSLQLKTRSLKIMPDLSNLTNLVELSLSDESYGIVRSNLIQPCHFLWTGGLSKLRKMDLNLFKVHTTSSDWAYFPLLKELSLCGLDLQTRQQLPSNLRVLDLFYIQGKQIELDGLPQLEKLTILRCELTRLSITSSLRKLREATVHFCYELVEVQFIGVLQSMKILDIRSCRSLEGLVCVSEEEPGCNELQPRELTANLQRASIVSGSLKMLGHLSLEECPELQELQFVSMMESLENLVVDGCHLLRRLGGLSNLKNLKNLLIRYAHSLQIVEGIDELEYVERLMIHGCKSIGMIIDVSTSKIPDKCQVDLSFCGELPRTCGSISWECYRENVLNAQTQASDFDIRTDPYHATLMWKRYRKDIEFSDCKIETGDPLLEQQDDGDKDDDDEDDGRVDDEEDDEHEDHENNDGEDDEVNNVHSSRRPSPDSSMDDHDENDDVDKEFEGEADRNSCSKEDDDDDHDEEKNEHEVLRSSHRPLPVCSFGNNDENNNVNEVGKGDSNGDKERMRMKTRLRTRKRKRGTMKKPKGSKMTVMTTTTMNPMTTRKTMVMKKATAATRKTMSMRFCSRLAGLHRFISWTTMRRRKLKGEGEMMATTRKRKRAMPKRSKMTVMTTTRMNMTMKNTVGATTMVRKTMATRKTMRMRFCSRLAGLYRFIPWTTTMRRRKTKGKSESMATTRKRKRVMMKKPKRR